MYNKRCGYVHNFYPVFLLFTLSTYDQGLSTYNVHIY